MYSASDILSGEQFQELCDAYCGTQNDLQRNPRISTQLGKHIYIDYLQQPWNNPSLLFCYSCSLKIFIHKLHLIKNPFVLVSHNEDTNITEEYKILLDSPMLKRWFAQNVMLNHPKLESIPIGVANTMWEHGNIQTLLTNIEEVKEKTNDIYFFFSLHTNFATRQPCKEALEKKGLHFGIPQGHSDYLRYLGTHKFAICPEGNGIDCHRTWECYYMGVIPILIENTFTRILQQYLPCILLKSWDDFNMNILTDYERLSKQLIEAQPHLTLSYYKDKITKALREEINIAYAFIGTLPPYCIDTVKQTRLFYDGPIYFIVSDYESPYVKVLESYNVSVVRYEDVLHKEFNQVVEVCYNKFSIVENLVGREKLFIYSFERFFILYKLMEQKGIKNVFFMELDNLIYDSPSNWLESFSKMDMAYMYDNENRYASGVSYMRTTKLLKSFCDYAMLYIWNSREFISEMICLSNFYILNKDKVQLLPVHWPNSTYPVETYKNFPLYNSLFDAAGMGVFLGGVDPFHVNITGTYSKLDGNKSHWSLIDYTKYSYKWEVDSKGRKVPYIYDGTNWLRINNLHIHSKDLKPMMSKSEE